MAVKKKKLNKGLYAIFGGDITSLIDDIENNAPESSQEKIKLDEIRPNPYQPRKVFDEQALNELALSRTWYFSTSYLKEISSRL